MSSSFIGEKEVSFQDVDAEANKVVVTYADGSKETFPYEGFQERLSPIKQVKDLTKERDDRVIPVVQKILQVCLDAKLKLIDLDYVMARFTGSIENNMKKASDHHWGKALEDRTLEDLDKILRQYEDHKQGNA